MTSPLAWSHRTTEIPEAGLNVRRVATAAEGAALAEDLDIVSCEALEADYVIGALGEGRYRLKGKLTAQVTRECVVTLEPVSEEIAEEIDISFWPFNSLPGTGEEEMEVSSIPEVEAIEHGQIDAGRVLFEILSASLDPYPRKPGARFEWEEKGGDEPSSASGPFAGLKKLKNEP
jgi:uncharacterized metal-binding protein YceD (DUF177 family)